MENFIQIEKKARFQSFGNVNSSKLLVVLHGYGQLAEYFIKNFECLAEQDYFIIAPEGLHRFYLKGASGRVGASWMTKELRTLDIEENINYLEKIVEFHLNQNTYNSISVLGFSQGGATATRWFSQSKFKIENFVLWACVFPEDVDLNLENERFNSVEKIFVLGNQDEYFEGEIFQQMNDFYIKNNFKVLNFEGKHELNDEVLKIIFPSN